MNPGLGTENGVKSIHVTQPQAGAVNDRQDHVG